MSVYGFAIFPLPMYNRIVNKTYLLLILLIMFKLIWGLSYSDANGNLITHHGNHFNVVTVTGKRWVFDSFLQCINFCE